MQQYWHERNKHEQEVGLCEALLFKARSQHQGAWIDFERLLGLHRRPWNIGSPWIDQLPYLFQTSKNCFFSDSNFQDNINDCRKPEAEGLFWVPFAGIHGIHHLYHSRPQSSSSRTLWITFFVKGSQQRFGASDKVHPLQDELGGFNPEYLTKNHCGSNKKVCDQPPKVPV